MLQYVISGMAAGSLYALLGLGLALTFRSTNVLNFAQSEFAMLLAFVAYFLIVSFGLPMLPALSITVAAAVIGGLLVYNLFIYPIRRRNEEELAIVTLGMKLAIVGLAAWGFGPGSLNFPSILDVDRYEFSGLVIGASQAWTIIASFVAMVLIAVFLKYTPMGLAMRAAAEDTAVAQLLGVNLRVVGSIAWIAAMLVGGVTGVLFATTTLLGPYMMGMVILKAFAALVVGGMTSIPGVIVGGLFVGVAESMVSYWISPLFQDSLSLVIIIIVLLLKPEGLFGSQPAWRA